MSITLKNIKVPYPTEGVIRSAQLNDTVTPENSVQVAVNANFDRVGAITTRPGMTQYATDLTGQVKNFGKLNNSILPDGNSMIYQFGNSTPFSNFSGTFSLTRINDDYVLYLYAGKKDGPNDNAGYAIVGLVNNSTGAVFFPYPEFKFEASVIQNIAVKKIDATHYLVAWSSTANFYFQVFEVNSGSYAISKLGSPTTLTGTALRQVLGQVDANHFICFWTDITSSSSKSQVIEINLSTWATSLRSTAITFTTGTDYTVYSSCSMFSDGFHSILFFTMNGTSDDGYAQVFTINNSTYAVTANGTKFTFDSGSPKYVTSASLGDNRRFIAFWNSSDGGRVQCFDTDPSTYAVSALGSYLLFAADGSLSSNGLFNKCLALDPTHFVNFWNYINNTSTPPYSVMAQCFYVNPSTYVISKLYNLQIISHGLMSDGAIALTKTYKIMYVNPTTGTIPGPITILMCQLFGDRYYNNLLYAQQNNGDVLSWDGASWASRRTSLKNTKKARFANYLSYIWMVNGSNGYGDSMMTSNGGTFSTNLVPIGFPDVDYISAGFEGRIWGLDSVMDIIYYSDIIQFTQPFTFSITYTDSNFISKISPQNGETFTGIVEVPRALLVFKQNHIYRIYGASSLDAYPAYNVGTYSQESIITAKDGIYFHHSSGFYKFDYGGQPIEISRRVIDFVKAIPRSYYENITGIYDGNDAVKWYVGPVTVEGVSYTNCVMRYTISTQVWTIYNYEGNAITTMIIFDDGTTLNQISGTSTGKVSTLDTGTTDLGAPINFEVIDRWRSFTDMYAKSKSVSGMNVYTENATGMRVEYQTEKSTVNKWEYIDKVRDEYDALFPNASTDDFAGIRFRYVGQNSGTPIIIHGVELLSIQDKGFEIN